MSVKMQAPENNQTLEVVTQRQKKTGGMQTDFLNQIENR